VKNVKRNIVIAAVLLFVCAAAYLNWSYNNRWGEPDAEMVAAEDEAIARANDEYLETAGESGETEAVSGYFAEARLSRQQSRDEALGLLERAAGSEGASPETVDSAMDAISTMARWTMAEAQIENILIAKDFVDCVVFMTEDSVTVTVPAPSEGLTQVDVAQITEIITTETDYPAAAINIIEVKNG